MASEYLPSDKNFFLRESIQILAMTLLCWDHLLTFGDEVKYFWLRPKNLISYLFLANRYVALISTITFTTLQTYADLSASAWVCKIVAMVRPVSLLVCGALVTALISLRIYALYNRSRAILGIMIFSALVVLSVASWSLWTDYSKHGAERDPGVESCTESPRSRAVLWITFLLHDSLNFVLTVWRSWSIWKERRTQKMEIPLLTLMVRDGGVYYITVCAGFLANTVTFYLFSQTFHGAFTSLAGCIAVVISSRIIINFHIAAEKRRALYETESPTHNAITSSPDAIELTRWSEIISFGHDRITTTRRDMEIGQGIE